MSVIGGEAEKRWIEVELPVNKLKKGDNTLAVEVHQIAPDSSDLSFALDLRINVLTADELFERYVPWDELQKELKLEDDLVKLLRSGK